MTAAPSRTELEAIAAALEASGDYRVVRRLEGRPPCPLSQKDLVWAS